MDLQSIVKPTLILDEEKCRKNISSMVSRARELGVDFRPHFKTHQSLEIGRWFRELGVSKITVSSLDMANYFSKEWDDITIAFPVNIREIDTINHLANKIKLNLLIESEKVVQILDQTLENHVQVFIKVNIGNNRAGLNPNDHDRIKSVLNCIASSEKIDFKGFLGHAGQTYKCRNENDIQQTHDLAKSIFVTLKDRYRNEYPNLILSYGDTPSCSKAINFEGIDEIRPGNFVFYDTMQVQIGSCSMDQIAVALACPIVAIHEEKEEMIIYGGGIHLSKDRLHIENINNFGSLALMTSEGWKIIDKAYVKSLSQEHGVIHMSKDQIKDFSVGGLIMVLPVHSCMTADLMKHYVCTSGTGISMMHYQRT